MSTDPRSGSFGNKIRVVVTSCLVAVAVLCTVWMTSSKPSGEGEGFDRIFVLTAGFLAFDVIALLVLGIWILRPPVRGTTHYLGRWAGKVVLFLGLGLATIVFLFATCLAIGS